jgi:hypothetical protein|tara:strand:+ start:329 stop:463 length:135 start_codon:yes stop_codon:yes gene_type:complete
MKFIKKLKELVKKDKEQEKQKDKKKETWEEKIERLRKKDPFIYK